MTSIFGFIGIPLGWIMSLIYNLVHNYGWSLILFIILVRVLMIPLGIKQQKSSAKMAAFQPKLQQLQKKYGKDKNRYQEEMMKLYEQEGVSPTSGCLPMVLQMVLLFGIIDVIYNPLKHILHIPADAIANAIKLLGNTAGSAPQLKLIHMVQAAGYNGQFDAALGSDAITNIKGFGMQFLGLNLGDIPSEVWGLTIIIPILSFVAQFVFTLISMAQQKKNGMETKGMMKWFMLIMPLFSLFIAFGFPVGVGIYWTINSVIMILQQIVLQKLYPPEKVAVTDDKATARAREKMRKKREQMEEYNKQLAAQGKAPAGRPVPQKEEAPKLSANEKELAKKRLAEARKRMAEKYGEDYKED